MKLLAIFTTLYDNEVSDRRRENLLHAFARYPNIEVLTNEGLRDLPYLEINQRIARRMLVRLTEVQDEFDYAMVFDDDFDPIEDFVNELSRTMEQLPADWRALHLCPGWLWGRKFRRCTRAGKLDPEGSIENLTFHESRRVFVDLDSATLVRKQMWLGGPIAVVVKRHELPGFLADFDRTLELYDHPSDVLLTRAFGERDYVCAEPQLGFEKPQGPTSYRR